MRAYCKKDHWIEDICVFSEGDIIEINKENQSIVNCKTRVTVGNISKENLDTIINTKVRIIDSLEDDNVNHPSHYTSHPSGIECIEITRHYCFSIGNAIKYLWRAGLKKEMGLEDKQKEIEDLEKAIWYIKDRIAQLKKPREFKCSLK